MSNRWPQIYDSEENERYRRIPGHYRYPFPQKERMSPIVIIVLILAAITCMIICGIVMLIPLRWMFVW
jgi:hypothetical protein